MVLSYSLREETLRARLSLMRASRSVRMRRSFWILAFSSSSAAMDLLSSSRFSRSYGTGRATSTARSKSAAEREAVDLGTKDGTGDGQWTCTSSMQPTSSEL